MYSCVNVAECLQHLPVLVNTHPALRKMDLHQTLAVYSLVLSTSTKPPSTTQASSIYLRALGRCGISDRLQGLLSQTRKVIQTPLLGVSENIKEVQLCYRMRSAVSSTHTGPSAEIAISTRCGAWLVRRVLNTRHHFLHERILATAPKTEMRKCVFGRETDDQDQKASKAP